MILYAIYKKGLHKGNQRGANELDAIQKYIIESKLEEYVNDDIFLKFYSAKIAVNGVHFKEKVSMTSQ